jgi:hypothetical protein
MPLLQREISRQINKGHCLKMAQSSSLQSVVFSDTVWFYRPLPMYGTWMLPPIEQRDHNLHFHSRESLESNS